MTWQLLLGIALAIFVLLMIAGYFLGPQGGPPITKRDQEILARRAAGTSPRQQRAVLDAYQLARNAVEDAREMAASGAGDEDALAQGFNNLLKDPNGALNYGSGKTEYLAHTFGMVANILMKHGVLNPLSEIEIEAVAATPTEVVAHPDLIVRVCGVLDLDAWPPLD